jgi:hypothetical protein
MIMRNILKRQVSCQNHTMPACTTIFQTAYPYVILCFALTLTFTCICIYIFLRKCITDKKFSLVIMITDKTILDLWRDPTFSGSYRGVRTFQIRLKTDLNIDVSSARLYSVLKKDPIFLIHTKPKRNFERRHYDLHSYGELVQADIAQMFEYNSYKYFLLLIDCFSSKIFVQCLKTKNSDEVAKAFATIFKEFDAEIHVLETDRGKEFLGATKLLFKKEKIYYKQKYGKNKANFAENGIAIIKKKLYMLLRGTLKHNWVDEIQNIVKSYNETPIKKLGWLKPSSIHSEFDSVRVEDARLKNHIEVYHEPDFKTQVQNQKDYERNTKNLQIGAYVYLDFDEKLFSKSFDVQVLSCSKVFKKEYSRFA